MHSDYNTMRQYQVNLKRLRYMLILQGVILFLISLLTVKQNSFTYVFIILNTIFLFCEINLRHSYNILIIFGLFILIKQIIDFLMFLFYRAQNLKNINPTKIIVLYSLTIIVLMKMILVTWRHYQNKVMQNVNEDEIDQLIQNY